MLPARILLLLTLALSARALAVEEDSAFFEKKVRPILTERCLDCHSAAKKVKGGLRLDLREGWAKGGDSGPAITPGDPEKSLVVEAIRYANRDLQMPPKQKLSAAEEAVLEVWVRLGAPDPRENAAVAPGHKAALSIEEGRKFWCYKPVQRPAAPAVKDEAWPRGEIDRFILARVEAAGLAPAPEASAEALVRRLSFSLVGLPPTVEQVSAFVQAAATDRPRAVAELTDGMLASPQFGEAWGRHWLDVARFAESSGGGRTLLFKDAWHYRDYVIDAFNRDLPFDRFIQEQLAGDLLPAANPSERRRQLTATAFLALGPTNYEEQDKQQLRFDVIDEQLETIGRAFLGQTIGCARCHDHKFDPILQRDYYAMAGIMASTRTLLSYTDNVARWITSPLPAEGEQEAVLQTHEAKLTSLATEIETAKARLAELTKGVSEPSLAPGKAIAVADLPGIVLDDSVAKVVGEWKHSTYIKSYIGTGYLSDNNVAKGEKTVTFTPAIPKTGRYEVRLAYAPMENRAKNVRVTVFHADGEESVYVDQTLVPPLDGRFVSLGKFRFEKDGAGYVLISNENTKGYVTIDALQLLPGDDSADSKVASTDQDEVRRAKKALAQIESQLTKLKKEGPRRETAMCVRDDDAIADTQIRVRGLEKQRGDTVPRGFLQVTLAAAPAPLSAESSGRRDLADWIASPRNPLTARVLVNRVWNWLFGSGLVRTVDLFSTTGEAPTDPALLDHLAARFMEEGWSVKRLIREIVLSRTWQQAVQPPSAQDPENRLFAHANRRRLDADQLRDSILAVSGALDLTVGGANIAGAGEIDANNFSAQNIEYGYVFADTRRSVYTPAFRNKRLELFEVFDFGDANQPTGQRPVSTVAPQALYLLNHPFVIEQARRTAESTLAAASTDDARLSAAFRRALGRDPSDAERATCLRYLSAGAPDSPEAWTQIQQSLFACLDFRYLN